MQELCVLEYLTVLDVVSLGIAKAGLKILSDGVNCGILLCLEFALDVVESYGSLDLQVVVCILPPRRKTHELK